MLPFPAIPLPVNPIYATLGGDTRAVVDIPVSIDQPWSIQHQLIHKRPVIDGYLAHSPATIRAAQVPGLRDFWYLTHISDIVRSAEDAQNALSYYRIGSVAVRQQELTAHQTERVQSIIEALLPGVRPRQYTPDVRVYDVPPLPGAPHTFGFPGAGWYEMEYDTTGSFRWMGATAHLILVNPHSTPTQVELELTIQSYQQPRLLTINFDQKPLLSFIVPTQPRTAWVPLTVPPGERAVVFSSQPEIATDQRELSVQVREVVIHER